MFRALPDSRMKKHDEVWTTTGGGMSYDIERYARMLGVNHLIVRVQWPGMSQEDALGQIAQLGREVVQRTRSSEPRLPNGASISAGPKG